jgi:hypothetical protein
MTNPSTNDRLRRLDDTLQAMYEVISFPEGGEPDWARMSAVFLPNARLTRITHEGVDCLDLTDFQAMALELLDRGVYTSFFERETARRTSVFGSLAHVLSAYETRRSPHAASFIARGVNSIQLLWNRNAWRVLNLSWDEETPGESFNLEQVFAEEVVCGKGAPIPAFFGAK